MIMMVILIMMVIKIVYNIFTYVSACSNSYGGECVSVCVYSECNRGVCDDVCVY